MTARRRQLEETARCLRGRLAELQARHVSERERPIHEVAMLAVRASLTDVGQQLSRMAA